MTEIEMKAWILETEESKFFWKIDEISYLNRGDLLAYRGGDHGKYITVEASGLVRIGTYEGAFPHIGEAIFKETDRIQMADFSIASARLFEICGVVALRKFICGY